MYLIFACIIIVILIFVLWRIYQLHKPTTKKNIKTVKKYQNPYSIQEESEKNSETALNYTQVSLQDIIQDEDPVQITDDQEMPKIPFVTELVQLTYLDEQTAHAPILVDQLKNVLKHTQIDQYSAIESMIMARNTYLTQFDISEGAILAAARAKNNPEELQKTLNDCVDEFGQLYCATGVAGRLLQFIAEQEGISILSEKDIYEDLRDRLQQLCKLHNTRTNAFIDQWVDIVQSRPYINTLRQSVRQEFEQWAHHIELPL